VALWAMHAHAAPEKLDYLKSGSQVYSNVTVLRITDTDVFFSHDKGFANAKLKYLDAAVQKKFDYDPDVASQAERKQNRDDSLFQVVVASNIVARAEKDAHTNAPEENIVDSVSDKSPLGKPGPGLEAVKWLGEKPVTKGKYVLLYFWAPSSVACKKANPELNALQKRYAENLVVVGLAAEPQQEIEAADPKLECPSAMDARAKLRTGLGITSIPSVLLLDSKGIVRYQGHPAAITGGRLQNLFVKPNTTSVATTSQ
jgi:thiol-disulfide isomerase/thioredoxin